jgi:hypothetical protein
MAWHQAFFGDFASEHSSGLSRCTRGFARPAPTRKRVNIRLIAVQQS